LLSLADDEIVKTLDYSNPDGIRALAFSPDSKSLAVAGWDGSVELFTARSRGRDRGWKPGPGAAAALAFDPDGAYLAPDGRTLLSGGADGTVRLWDVASGRERRSYRWHQRWVTCAAPSPDGMTAAAGSDDSTIVVWDLDDE
jgi:WD40 repeat protein